MNEISILGCLCLALVQTLALLDIKPSRVCTRLQMYNDYIETIKEGLEWRERCRTCRCQNSQVTCILDRGKTCAKKYDPSVDRYCVEWDRSGCCCLKLGCRVEGVVYNFGESFVLPAGLGCTRYCPCSPFSSSNCVVICPQQADPLPTVGLPYPANVTSSPGVKPPGAVPPPVGEAPPEGPAPPQ